MRCCELDNFRLSKVNGKALQSLLLRWIQQYIDFEHFQVSFQLERFQAWKKYQKWFEHRLLLPCWHRTWSESLFQNLDFGWSNLKFPELLKRYLLLLNLWRHWGQLRFLQVRDHCRRKYRHFLQMTQRLFLLSEILLHCLAFVEKAVRLLHRHFPAQFFVAVVVEKEAQLHCLLLFLELICLCFHRKKCFPVKMDLNLKVHLVCHR